METSVIVNIALVVVNIALVVVNWIYTRHTKSMADTMAKEFELTTRPYLRVVKLRAIHEGNSIHKIIFKIENAGKIPAKVSKGEITFRNTRVLIPKNIPQIIIYPRGGNKIVADMMLEIPSDGIFNLKIEIYYHALGVPEKKYKLIMVYEYNKDIKDFKFLDEIT